ncbi:MarR family transcriptional regulator [Tsuneonella suprasediminis]|uniref:MarR family winged helix-turn-helix transcriptional regulator n=1 Tax=Tsuneonella suprasediminis TaxID=2306996 RepID=UPI002F95C18E
MENSTAYLLSDSARLLRREFNVRVRSLGITSAQARLLLLLDRKPGENQAFYADRLEIEPITLCRMVDRMEDAGLVERQANPSDRRARLLFLTEKSRKEIARIRQVLKVLMETMLTGFSGEEESQLMGLLQRVSVNLGSTSNGEPRHG